VSKVAKRVVITGAAGALGVAVAHAFARPPCKLALIDRAADSKDLTQSIGRLILPGRRRLTDAARRNPQSHGGGRFGGVTCWSTSQAGFAGETIADGKFGDVGTFLYAINLKSAVCHLKAALPICLPSRGDDHHIGLARRRRPGMGMGCIRGVESRRGEAHGSPGRRVERQGRQCKRGLPSIIDTAINRADMPTADF